MLTRTFRWATLALAIGLAGGELLACGDKFLVPGRGARFARSVADRQASTLLIWAPPASPLADALARLGVVAWLGKVGYRPTVVATTRELERALSEQRWDVVVADVSQGAAVRARVAGGGSTHVVVVTPKVSRAELTEARAQFPVVLRAPSRAQDFLDAVDIAGMRAQAERAHSERASP